MTDAAENAATTAATPAGLPTVRATLASIEDGSVELALAHTDYRLRFVLGVDAERVAIPVGKRIRGTVVASAMKFLRAAGGGRFVEPVVGEPRIVTGTVLHVDREGGRVLIDVSLPIWIEPNEDQDWDEFEVGALATGYLHSDPVFTPRDADLTGG